MNKFCSIFQLSVSVELAEFPTPQQVSISFLRNLLVIVLFCVVLMPAFGDSHLSTDPAVQTARELVKQEKFAEALNLLRPIVAKNSQDTDAAFLLGLAAKRYAQLTTDAIEKEQAIDEAINVLYSILIDKPELIRVRLELAHSFFIKGEDDLARNHFERVLAGNPT